MKLLTTLKPETSSVIFRWLLVVMVLCSMLSLGRSIMKNLGAQGGIDFHAYWYSGHFVRQGHNPYAAFLEHKDVQVPIRYIDHVIIEKLPVAQPALAMAPTNTAPLVLLLSGFSWLSWPTAKTLWFLINLIIVFFLPWLVLHLLPEDTLNRTQSLFISLAFYLFSGTRVAVWTGQTTLVVFLFMIGALLLLSKHWFVSGILLGIALSKYSLALPAFLFVLYRREYRVVVVSLVVQTLGLLIVAYLGQESPLLVLNEYFLIFREHASLQGQNCEACIHLATLLSQRTLIVDLGISIGLIVLTFGLLWIGISKFQKSSYLASKVRFLEFHILAVFTLVFLLVGYHRIYDVASAIIFVVLLMWGLAEPENWHLAKTTTHGVMICLGLFIIAMTLPGEIGAYMLPERLMATWLQIFNASMTLGLFFALGVSLFLLGKVS